MELAANVVPILYTGRAELGHPNCEIHTVRLNPALASINAEVQNIQKAAEPADLYTLLSAIASTHTRIAYLLDHLAAVAMTPRLPDLNFFDSQFRTAGNPARLFRLKVEEAYPFLTTVSGGRKIVELLVEGSFLHRSAEETLALVDPYFSEPDRVPQVIRVAIKNMGDTKTSESLISLADDNSVQGRGTADPREFAIPELLKGTYIVYDRHGRLVQHQYVPSRIKIADFPIGTLTVALDQIEYLTYISGEITPQPSDVITENQTPEGTAYSLALHNLGVADERFPLITGPNQLTIEAFLEIGGPDFKEIAVLLEKTRSLEGRAKIATEEKLYQALAMSLQHLDYIKPMVRDFLRGGIHFEEFRRKIWGEIFFKTLADMQVELSKVVYGVNRTPQNRGIDGGMRDPDDSQIRDVPLLIEEMGLPDVINLVEPHFAKEIGEIIFIVEDAYKCIIDLLSEPSQLHPSSVYLLASAVRWLVERKLNRGKHRNIPEEVRLLAALRDNPYMSSWGSFFARFVQ